MACAGSDGDVRTESNEMPRQGYMCVTDHIALKIPFVLSARATM